MGNMSAEEFRNQAKSESLNRCENMLFFDELNFNHHISQFHICISK